MGLSTRAKDGGIPQCPVDRHYKPQQRGVAPQPFASRSKRPNPPAIKVINGFVPQHAVATFLHCLLNSTSFMIGHWIEPVGKRQKPSYVSARKQQPTFGHGHSVELAQKGPQVRNVLEQSKAGNQVETISIKRKRFRIALNKAGAAVLTRAGPSH